MPFMESQIHVHVLSPLKLLLTLWLCVLLCTVSVRGNYQFTVRFYEFRNPLGLQCGECESRRPPACCDDVQRTANCINEDQNVGPRRCDTRFRFILRPFGAPVEAAPNGGFPHFTPSNGGNSKTFIEAPGGFLSLPNPFTINNTSDWTGRIQFFIDALDRAVRTGESEVLINRFPINLELKLGANFTGRTTYTGIYNISHLGFDMSFRVHCSENYYGPDCITFCKALDEVYTCNDEGKRICLLQRGLNPATNCTTCLPEWEPKTNCTTCLAPFYDIQTDCIQCLPGRDITSSCDTCLPGYNPSTNCTECLTGRDETTSCTTCLQAGYDPSTNCTECLTGRDRSTNCTTCLRASYDPSTNCTSCLWAGYDPSTACTQCLTGRDESTNCTTCLPGYDSSTESCNILTTTIDSGTCCTPTSSPAAPNLAVVGGAVGGAAILLILILVILCVIVVITTIQLRRQRQKYTVAGTVTALNNAYLSHDSSIKETAKVGGEHDFHNPLYDESKQNGSQWEADNSAYSKLQHPPVQKSFVPPKFPYTMERSEETSYQLDVAGKGADDGLNSEHPAYDIAYPPPPPPSFNETGETYDVTHHPNHQFLGPSPATLAGGIYNLANYPEQPVYDDANLPPRSSTVLPRNDYSDITDIPGSTVTASQAPTQHDYADIPDPQSSNAPHYDYADVALSVSSPPPPAANDPTMSHDYAETEDVVTRPQPSESPSNVAYANTTPGQVTPEAMDHYDFNQ